MCPAYVPITLSIAMKACRRAHSHQRTGPAHWPLHTLQEENSTDIWHLRNLHLGKVCGWAENDLKTGTKNLIYHISHMQTKPGLSGLFV